MTNPRRHSGFTLVELIMVIVIMGVIGGMVSVFMKSPIDAYFASGRRAGLTDVADTTVRRIARDVQRALPNSIRTSGTNCVEFIPTKTGGRYRTQDAAAGTSLDFSTADSSFNMLGSNSALPSSQQIVANDLIVLYNLGNGTGSDAYVPNNSTAVTSLGAETSPPIETPINITAKQFPLASGSNRFHVVSAQEQMVSYVCDNASHNLYRARSTTITAAASCPTVTTGTAFVSVMANHVNCSASWFDYSGVDLLRNGLLSMGLTIQDSSADESVTLQHEVHVSNTP